MGLDTFWGSIRAFHEHRLLSWSAKHFEELEVRTLGVNILGVDLIMTIEPKNLQTILALKAGHWGLGERRKTSFKPLLGDGKGLQWQHDTADLRTGIFTTDGPESAHSRGMLRPNFTKKQFTDFAPLERRFVSWSKDIPKDGSTVDLAGHFFHLTIAFSAEFLFGESVEALAARGGEGFEDAFDSGQNHTFFLFRFGTWIQRLRPLGSLFGQKKFEEDCRLVHQLVDHLVDEAFAKESETAAQKDEKSSSSERYIFLAELARRTANRERARSELLNVLVAGRDTTASLLTTVWFMLSKRPDLWDRLQSEVEELKNGPPTFEQLGEMKFLQALLKESLRLHPVVPQNYREALQDTTLPVGAGLNGGAPLKIVKGQVVAWSLYAMHRRKDLYGDDAEDFKPERWLDEPATGRKGLRPGWGYLPFNGGARICLGQQYALTQVSYTTVRLCQLFSGIESRDPCVKWREKLHFTCLNLYGAKVSLKPRQKTREL